MTVFRPSVGPETVEDARLAWRRLACDVSRQVPMVSLARSRGAEDGEAM